MIGTIDTHTNCVIMSCNIKMQTVDVVKKYIWRMFCIRLKRAKSHMEAFIPASLEPMTTPGHQPGGLKQLDLTSQRAEPVF